MRGTREGDRGVLEPEGEMHETQQPQFGPGVGGAGGELVPHAKGGPVQADEGGEAREVAPRVAQGEGDVELQ